MDFNDHSKLAGLHAFLSPSKYHWVNYDDQKLDAAFIASMASRRGTELHALANELIRLRELLPNRRRALNMYVNDAIRFRLHPEQVVYYSDNAFGTCDAIGLRNTRRRKTLRIQELKTGIAPTYVHQLEVYAALFCLEYRFDPNDIDIELVIYQREEVKVFEGDPEEIRRIMNKIVDFDKRIDRIRREVL